MKKLLLLGILICFCLGNWQIYRFFYKKKVNFNLQTCVLREAHFNNNYNNPDSASNVSANYNEFLPKLAKSLYCRMKQYKGKIITDKIMFLFKGLQNNNGSNDEGNNARNNAGNNEIYYVIAPIQINIDGSYVNALINLGYIKNSDRPQILKALAIINNLNNSKNDSNNFSFDAIIMPGEQKIRIPLLKNDLKNNKLYFLDILELQKKTGLFLEKEILYSINNSFTAQYPELIINNKEIEVKILLHIGYAIMWYMIALGGFVIFLLKKPS